MEVLDIIEACKVTVFGEDDAKAKFIDCGLGGVSAMLPSLQSPPKFGQQQGDELDLNGLCFDKATLEFIQKKAKYLFQMNRTKADRSFKFTKHIFEKFY